MMVLAPLWLALLIMLFSRPVYALKMIAAFLLGATIGLGLLALIAARSVAKQAGRSAQKQKQLALAPREIDSPRVRRQKAADWLKEAGAPGRSRAKPCRSSGDHMPQGQIRILTSGAPPRRRRAGRSPSTGGADGFQALETEIAAAEADSDPIPRGGPMTRQECDWWLALLMRGVCLQSGPKEPVRQRRLAPPPLAISGPRVE